MKMARSHNNFLLWIKKNSLIVGTIFGVIIGAGLGFALRPANISLTYIDLISYPGELFSRALQLLVLPLIISSLIYGSSSLNAKLNGKIAIRTLIFFFVTSLLNAIIGVILAITIHPGSSFEEVGNFTEIEERKNTLLDNILDLGRNIVPSNVFQALFQQTQTIYEKIGNDSYERHIVNRDGTNSLGIITFALMFGTVLGTMGESARNLINSIGIIDKIMMIIISGIIKTTPFGVASIIASKILTAQDIGTMLNQLGLFIGTVSIGIFVYQLIILQLIYLIILRKNPFTFYIGLMQASITAFSTASAAVSLPVTFRCMEKLEIDTRISRFILPIGASINKDGTALFVATASIFIAQMNNISLGFGDLCTVAITATAVSIASASIPSAALALMFIVLNAIGVPTHDVGLLFAVDWFVDRLRTVNNVLGDCYCTAVVEHFSKKELSLMDNLSDDDDKCNDTGSPSPKDISISTDHDEPLDI